MSSIEEQLRHTRHRLYWTTGGLVLYALVILLWFFFGEPSTGRLNEITTPAGYKSFFQKPNWVFYFLFFPVVAYLVHLSWDGFIRAWTKLPTTQVMLRCDNKAIDEKDIMYVVSAIFQHRRWLLVVALVLAVIFNAFDAYELYRTHIKGDMKYSQQLAVACKEPDFMHKWLFKKWAFRRPDVKLADVCQAKSQAPNVEEDQREKWLAEDLKGNLNEHVTAGWQSYMQTVTVFLEQLIISIMAAMVLVQLLWHAWLFLRFERSRVARDKGLYIELNIRSPIHEFGLEHWNDALNRVYWGLCVALFIPLISRASQDMRDPSSIDSEQTMLNVGVSLIVAAPMLFTIIVRQVRLAQCWKLVDAESGEMFHKQMIWPFDRNWASKLGIVLAFLIISILLGKELIKL